MKVNNYMENNVKMVGNGQHIPVGDSIKILGEVEIRNGDTVIKAKNKFVQTILQHITNALSNSVLYGGGGGFPTDGWHGPTDSTVGGPKMYVGTDIAQVTLYNTAALTTPIGGAPGTAPNLVIGNTSNPSNGVFQMSITATWNAETLPGNPTIGEMALYLNVYPAPANLKAFGWSIVFGSPYSPGAVALASRLSVADGSFVAFVVDSTKPLAITWTITVSF